MKDKRVTLNAIDVGTTKVAAIMANGSPGYPFQVVGVGVVPSQGLRKGIVTNIDEAKAVVQQAVRKAEQASGMRMETAYVGITGNHISSLNSRNAIAVTRGDHRVHTEDLKRVLQSARTETVSRERELLHVIPRDYILDGHEGIREPVGMHGFRLDADVHVVTAAASSVQNLVKCVRAAGVEVEDIVLESLASGEAVLQPDEKDAGAVLMDIGGGTTDVSVFKDGNIWYTSVLPVAGFQITRDIAIGLGIPFELAEKLKVKYGNVSRTNGKYVTPDSSVQVEDGHSVMVQDLNDIIRARVEEMLRLIAVELPDSDLASMAPAGIVLTGGTAKLPGIDVLAYDLFRLPVRVGMPQRIQGLTDMLYDPAFATGVGLLLWGFAPEEAESKGHGPRRWRRLVHRAARAVRIR